MGTIAVGTVQSSFMEALNDNKFVPRIITKDKFKKSTFAVVFAAFDDALERNRSRRFRRSYCRRGF